jgi:hypothetical protein
MPGGDISGGGFQQMKLLPTTAADGNDVEEGDDRNAPNRKRRYAVVLIMSLNYLRLVTFFKGAG